MTEGSRGFPGLELVAIMGILDKELHMHIDMHVNNDRGIVDNIMMKILEVSLAES